MMLVKGLIGLEMDICVRLFFENIFVDNFVSFLSVNFCILLFCSDGEGFWVGDFDFMVLFFIFL